MATIRQLADYLIGNHNHGTPQSVPTIGIYLALFGFDWECEFTIR